MPINATCQQCGATLPVPDEYAGKSVRCGGCQGVVGVPAATPSAPPPAAVPVARAARARPVAVPVAAKEKPSARAEAPLPKARKARDEAEPDADDDVPKARKAATRRPIAKRRRDSVLTPTAFKWLTLFLVTGTVGLGVLAYGAWGASRKNDGTAYVPPDENPPPVVPPPARPLPAPPQPEPIRPAPPNEVRDVVKPEFEGAPFNPNANPRLRNHQPPTVVPPRPADVPFRAGTNAVLARYAGRYTLSASTQFDQAQWTVAKAFDNDAGTSWYSASEGPAARPWVQVTFPEAVAVSRVVILGNRDQYRDSYTVEAGTVTLLDKDDKVLVKADLRGVGAKRDFDFAVAHAKVHAVRFTATASTNASMCVAVGEFQVE